jgi:hypothetical protein
MAVLMNQNDHEEQHTPEQQQVGPSDGLGFRQGHAQDQTYHDEEK